MPYRGTPAGGFSGHLGFDAGKGVSALAKQLFEIDRIRKQEARQKEQDAIAEEDRKLRLQDEDRERHLQRAALMQKVASLMPEPGVKKIEMPDPTKIGEAPAGEPTAAGSGAAIQKADPIKIEMEPTEKPEQQFYSFKDQATGQIENIPILTRAQQKAEEAERFRTGLGLKVEEKKALEGIDDTQVSELHRALRAFGIDLDDLPEDFEDVGLNTAATQSVTQGLMRMLAPAKPGAVKTINRPDGSVVERQPDGSYKTVLGPMAKANLVDENGEGLSDKVIGEMSDMRVMAKKAKSLINAPSDYKMEAVGWVPNILRNIGMGDPKDTDLPEGKAAEMAEKYQVYQPQYFMFAAEMLKAVQGSRPSDFDMQIYLENLPKISDRPRVKAQKLSRLIDQLTIKYNDRYDAFKGAGKDMGDFEKLSGVSEEEIFAKIRSDEEIDLGPPPNFTGTGTADDPIVLGE